MQHEQPPPVVLVAQVRRLHRLADRRDSSRNQTCSYRSSNIPFCCWPFPLSRLKLTILELPNLILSDLPFAPPDPLLYDLDLVGERATIHRGEIWISEGVCWGHCFLEESWLVVANHKAWLYWKVLLLWVAVTLDVAKYLVSEALGGSWESLWLIWTEGMSSLARNS